MAKTWKYFVISFVLVAFGNILTSCIYEEYPIENETDEESFEGDVLKFTFTLDNMGGGAATRAENPLAKWENYVDAEKVRVLVFDNEDKFLFESKNRYIKQLNPSPDHSTWSVTIPMGSYGNDKEYDWDWDEIRKRMSAKSFKIALLVNRPDREWNMGILKRTEDGKDVDPNDDSQWTGTPYVVPSGWFGSTGPHWDRTNSVASATNENDVKNVFHLHHCQYDPIYHGKNYYTTYNANKTYNYQNTNFDFYGCITGDENPDVHDPNNPYMGAASSWVDWGENDDAKDEWGFRYGVRPSEKRPIPMYGIQEYARLTGWKKGTSVNLDRDGDKAISLLRSVVKLELLVPQNTVGDVLLFYSNVYARCEPMDVWTPTDQLWKGPGSHAGSSDTQCEWNLIKDFGRMTISGDPYQDNNGIVTKTQIADGKRVYQERLSWVYGIWRKEKNWSFDNEDAETERKYTINSYFDNKYLDKPEGVREDRFVRIFNPCIQRNNTIHVEKCPGYNDGYDHYVVYTGERNINDASNLGQMGAAGSGPTVLYWSIIDKNTSTINNVANCRKVWSFAVVDYNNATTAANLNLVMRSGYKMNGKNPSNGTASQPSNTNSSSSSGFGNYLIDVQNGSIDESLWPLPLLRNHVYSITLAPTKVGSIGDEVPFAVHFEEKHTEDINFQ